MKSVSFNIIFVAFLVCLFALQGVWLYYTYRSESIKIQGILNETLSKSIEEEINSRCYFIGKGKIIYESPEKTYEYKYDENKGTFISQQFDFIQQILLHEGDSFNLARVDSIYAASLHEHDIHVQYCLHYTDSIGNVIASCGANIDHGFHTIVVPVVNGTKAGAIVEIPPPAVFRSMLGILTVSILIFLFIIACMIYEVKVFLTQRQLHQLRNDFVHALSHDMKTPLATIHSVLVQLQNGSLDAHPEKKREFGAIAVEQTLNIQSIVEQILTVAYMDRKQLDLDKQEINLPEIIRSLIDKFRVRKEKNIEFYEKYDLKEKPVYADPFYLKNAISNLIDNAIKYSGDAVKISIECTAENKWIYISIKDNGFGISKKDQQKIFVRFERGAEIKRKRISGFGLGLNYVKCVIEAHGGTVASVSREGVGSEFTVTIPVHS